MKLLFVAGEQTRHVFKSVAGVIQHTYYHTTNGQSGQLVYKLPVQRSLLPKPQSVTENSIRKEETLKRLKTHAPEVGVLL